MEFSDFSMSALTHMSKAKQLTEALVIYLSLCSLLKEWKGKWEMVVLQMPQ